MILTKTLPNAWNLFVKHKQYLILFVLLDFVFLFFTAQAHLTYFIPTADAANRAGEIITQELQTLQMTDAYQLDAILMQNSQFKQAYHDLLQGIIYFFITMFIIWIVIRSAIWHISYKIIHKKTNWKTNVLKFALFSLFWFVVVAIVFVLYSISTGSTATLLPIVGNPLISILMIALFVLIYYFSQISFALVPVQQSFNKTFAYGVKYAKKFVPVALINAIIVFLALSLPLNWLQTYPIISLAIIIIISIPALAFARVHIIGATEWVKKY